MNGQSIRLLSFASLIALSPLACARDAAPVLPTSPPPSPAAAPLASPPSGGSTALPEMAPTPYSAVAIRAANQPGTLYRYKVEKLGEPLRIKVLQFKTATSEAAEVESRELDEAGKEQGPAKVDKASWEELRRHAEFPRAALTVEPISIEVPAGKFDVNLYTVRAPKGDIMRFYFAKSYAGPPVLLSIEHDGARVMTQTLIERKAGGS